MVAVAQIVEINRRNCRLEHHILVMSSEVQKSVYSLKIKLVESCILVSNSSWKKAKTEPLVKLVYQDGVIVTSYLVLSYWIS